YVGLVPLAALPLAALAWRRPPTRFFAGLAVIAGLIHYGALAAVAPAPVIAFGSNLRLMPILVFALATLGALGVDSVARGDAGPRALAWLRGGFMALAGAGLVAVTLTSVEPATLAVRPSLAAQYVGMLVGLTAAAWLLRRWLVDGRARWGVALAAVQVATLAPLATYLPVRDARWLYPTPPAIAWLRDHAGSARVLIADQVGLLYGLRQAHGYDGLSPRRIAALAGPIGPGRALAARSRARCGGAAGRLRLAAAFECAGGAPCINCAGGADCNGCAGGAPCIGCAGGAHHGRRARARRRLRVHRRAGVARAHRHVVPR